jgi:hypothetical protein
MVEEQPRVRKERKLAIPKTKLDKIGVGAENKYNEEQQQQKRNSNLLSKKSTQK